MCTTGNHTFAAVKADENYTVVSTALKPVIDEINELIRIGEVKVGEVVVKLQFYFGGDYKVGVLMFPINLVTSLFSYIA